MVRGRGGGGKHRQSHRQAVLVLPLAWPLAVGLFLALCYVVHGCRGHSLLHIRLLYITLLNSITSLPMKPLHRASLGAYIVVTKYFRKEYTLRLFSPLCTLRTTLPHPSPLVT